MSQPTQITMPPPPTTTPATDTAIRDSQSRIDLVQEALANPAVAKVLDAVFGQISHSPAAQALALFLGLLATQEHLTVDTSLLQLMAAILLAGVGYGWQIVSKWLAKRKVAAAPAVAARSLVIGL